MRSKAVRVGLCKLRTEMRPIKRRSRIGLAPRRDVTMAHDACRDYIRISRHDGTGYGCKFGILRRCIGHIIAAFQFDADGEIIAGLATLIYGGARMPGALMERHELQQFTVATNQQVCGCA